MESKQQLLVSMEKLIKHIGKNRKNQQEIFNSLSTTDFRKILSNLSDSNQKLRITSLNLICLLINDNQILKKQFCSINYIPPLPDCTESSSPFYTSPPEAYHTAPQITTHPMYHTSQIEQYKTNLWYIHLYQPYQLNFINNISQYITIDPIDTLLGIIIPKTHTKISISELKNNTLEAYTDHIHKSKPSQTPKYEYQPENQNTIIKKYEYNNMQMSYRDQRVINDHDSSHKKYGVKMMLTNKMVNSVNPTTNHPLNLHTKHGHQTDRKHNYIVLGKKNQYQQVKPYQFRNKKPINSTFQTKNQY